MLLAYLSFFVDISTVLCGKPSEVKRSAPLNKRKNNEKVQKYFKYIILL